MITSADKMLSYCTSIGEELQSRLNRIRTFAQHNLSSGTANETILREFLAGHVPTMYSVSEGFVCNPLEANKSSRQCDILIFDQANFPLVYSVGSVVIVLPASTRLVIEVKTNFNKSDIRTALENIESARTLHHGIAGLIFTFKSPSLKTVIKHLTFYTSCCSSNALPEAIILFDKGVIIEMRRDEGTRKLHYVICQPPNKQKGIAIHTYSLQLLAKLVIFSAISQTFVSNC